MQYGTHLYTMNSLIKNVNNRMCVCVLEIEVTATLSEC